MNWKPPALVILGTLIIAGSLYEYNRMIIERDLRGTLEGIFFPTLSVVIGGSLILAGVLWFISDMLKKSREDIEAVWDQDE